MNAENITIEQSSRLTENYPWSAMKISDGQFKMRAVFNTGKTVGCRDFDLSVVDGKSHVLVGFIPTTAGNQTVWKRLETSQILPLNSTDSHYCYPQTIKLPATLGELWKELYGHVQPFAHREVNGVRFVQVGDTAGLDRVCPEEDGQESGRANAFPHHLTSELPFPVWH